MDEQVEQGSKGNGVPMAIQTVSVASWVFAKRWLVVGTLGESEGPEGECATRPFVGAGIGGLVVVGLCRVNTVRAGAGSLVTGCWLLVTGRGGRGGRGRGRGGQGTAGAGRVEWAAEAGIRAVVEQLVVGWLGGWVGKKSELGRGVSWEDELG